MEEPVRKRRKTASPEERERQSSPLRKPPRRPSFASPTKSSLARNYPNLYTAGSAPRSRSDLLARGKQARNFLLGEDNPTNGADHQQAEEEQAEAGAETGTRQNTTPRATRTATYKQASKDTLVEDEAELPLTPSQRDAPRRGVLYSSPSKRPPRVKDPVKQSPLKPKVPPIQDNVNGEREEEQEQDVAKKESVPDPEIEKRRQEKARLQRQVQGLEAQIARCTQEIRKEQSRAADDRLPDEERQSLCKFLSEISGTEKQAEQEPLISTLLCSFLPFSAMGVPIPVSKQAERPVPSHKPVKLTEPLPYLQMFTSLDFSTQLSISRKSKSRTTTQTHQEHTITIHGQQKLLTAQMSITVNVLKHEVVDMNILNLSSWASRELGTFVRAKAKEKDIGNAAWAIDSYWSLAKKRAYFWRRCETAFAHLIPGRTENDTENAGATGKPLKTISRKDLNRHLGRDILILQDKHVLLKLNWRIDFDWTGEARSQITADAAFPEVWSEADTGASLKKVSETFNGLLRSKGAFEATRIMVALLFAK